MDNNFNLINTDKGLATILSNFESDYIVHVMYDSLNMRFRPFEATPMPNIVDIYQRNFIDILNNSSDSYKEKIEEVQHDTFEEIINIICNFYNISCTVDLSEFDGVRIYSIARVLYDIFVCRFSENFISFIIRYIITNSDSIYRYLEKSEDSIKPKEVGQFSSDNYIDKKFILIHANIHTIVYNMISYDITLDDMLRYFLDPNIYNEFSNMFVDNENIYKNHFAIYISDPVYQAGIITNVKLRLQSETVNMAHLLDKQGDKK